MKAPNRKSQQRVDSLADARLTLTAAAILFGIERQTLKKRLELAGVTTGRGLTYSLPDVCRASVRALETARTVECEERAALLAMNRREREGELVRMSVVQSLAVAGWGPCRDAFNSLPTAVDSRANPSDPPHARAALTEWLDSVLPQIRAGMEAAFAIDLPDENDTKSAPKNHQDDPMVLPSTKPKRVRKR